MTRIALFASGSGSNVEAILEAVADGRLDVEPVLVFSNRADAGVLARAERYDVATAVRMPRDYADKRAYEEDVLAILQAYEVETIVLAGYMRLMGETLLEAYEGRIINIHPSLLPAFPGKDAIGQAWEAGVKVSGVTVHYVDEGMDTGPIIAQEAVRIHPTDSLASLTRAIQAVEHRLYPETLQQLWGKKEWSG
ncbi:phosphoribosylglycinamide formyltransferase [Salsuginibacillus kocurii]|uniref:phosphoribosylglycinamide formyltransferase n=1 Tax=Salsuginibacillus kocurii TaxID=427078 RepID=UPI00037C3DF2|nr:phosphoribosylglycinamide formyltransferase [Salsuginibacillus kocurii]